MAKYTVKTKKDGDVTVTQHNITKEFSLKEALLSFNELTKVVKQMKAQSSLWNTAIKECANHPESRDVVKMFEKMTPKKQQMLLDYLDLKQKTREHDLKMKTYVSDYNKTKLMLSVVRKLLPKVK